MKTLTTLGKSIARIESIISQRLKAEKLLSDLSDWEIDEIRLEVYRDNGWTYDPMVEDEAADDDDENENWQSRRLANLWMNEKDFF